jgi:biotin transport system substrate-specific component
MGVSVSYPRTRGVALCASFAVLLSASSVVSFPIPFSPVPVTLQVLAVLVISSILGPVYGPLCCLLYLMLGTAGLPVFHGGTSGIPVLLGPTGGFLLSFPLASLLGGWATRKVSLTRRADALRVWLGILLSLLSVYVVGVVWLAAYLGVGIYQAALLGALPFVAFDVAKAAVAFPIAMRLRWSELGLPINRSARSRPTGTLS